MMDTLEMDLEEQQIQGRMRYRVRIVTFLTSAICVIGLILVLAGVVVNTKNRSCPPDYSPLSDTQLCINENRTTVTPVTYPGGDGRIFMLVGIIMFFICPCWLLGLAGYEKQFGVRLT